MVSKFGTGGLVWTPTWVSAISAIFWPRGVAVVSAGLAGLVEAAEVAGLGAHALRAAACSAGADPVHALSDVRRQAVFNAAGRPTAQPYRPVLTSCQSPPLWTKTP